MMKTKQTVILAASVITATLVLSGSADAGSFWEKLGRSSRKTSDRSRTCAVDFTRGLRDKKQKSTRCYDAGKKTRRAFSDFRRGWSKKR
jgi:hypothetical protein